MHTVLTRGNALLTLTLSVLSGLTFCCFLSTALNPYSGSTVIDTVQVLVKNVPDYSVSKDKLDLGYVKFDLEADLMPLFNWNVKQLYVFLTAEYETAENKLNQVVLWDKIIRRGENANLKLKNMNPTYYFLDDGNGLRGNQNVTLTLSWNITPNAGILPIVAGTGSHSFSFPKDYTNARAQ